LATEWLQFQVHQRRGLRLAGFNAAGKVSGFGKKIAGLDHVLSAYAEFLFQVSQIAVIVSVSVFLLPSAVFD
jgi:hypothetical protein